MFREEERTTWALALLLVAGGVQGCSDSTGNKLRADETADAGAQVDDDISAPGTTGDCGADEASPVHCAEHADCPWGYACEPVKAGCRQSVRTPSPDR